MKRWIVGCTGLFLIALWSPSCVELTGQRAQIHYDPTADVLQIHLFYDGIHNGSPGDERALRQLRALTEDGDVALLEWPWVIRRSHVRLLAESQGGHGPVQALARQWLEQVEVETLGTYRDAHGRLGVAQRLTISDASDVVASINRTMDALIVHESTQRPVDPRRRLSLARQVRAARRGHQWIRLDGHSIVVDLPGHPREFQALVAQVLSKELRDLRGSGAVERLLAFVGIPGEWRLNGEGLRVRIGRADRATTWRFTRRATYNDSLETVLSEQIARPLLDPLATQILSPPGEERGLSELLRSSPPELRVGALLHAVENGDAARRTSALQALERFASDWNRTESVPRAPVRAGSTGAWISNWQIFREKLAAWPLRP